MSMVNLVLAVPERSLRTRAHSILRSDNDMKVVAVTSNLMETFNAVEELQPQAVLISRAMTGYEEFEVMRGLFKALRIRWLVIDSGNSEPSRRNGSAFGLFPISVDRPQDDVLLQIRSVLRISGIHNDRQTKPVSQDMRDRLLLIGASTGGVDALSKILNAFPSDCPPTMIVQHTGRGFGGSLVRLLDRQCSASVVQARSGLEIRRGQVCIGAGLHGHLVTSWNGAYQADVQKSGPVSGHMPSVDMLFRSASSMARSIVAVLLTGMGRDGAEGLLELRNAGARTIVQDEATSVVYGMPKVATEMGAAEFVLPLPKIADKALKLAKLPARV